MIEKGTFNRYQINIKFQIIKDVIERYQLKRKNTYQCESIGVSKSSYYNYLKNEGKRIEKQIKDEEEYVKRFSKIHFKLNFRKFVYESMYIKNKLALNFIYVIIQHRKSKGG